MFNFQKINSIPRNLSYDCFQENILRPICESLDINMNINFLNIFDFNVCFDFLDDNILNSECINGFHIEARHLNALEKFGGVKIVRTKKSKSDLIFNQEKVFGVLLDSYNLPWNEHFQMVHRKHFLLVLDRIGKNFLVYDKFLTNSFQVCDENLIVENYSETINFELMTPHELDFSVKKYIINGFNTETNFKRWKDINELALIFYNKKHINSNEYQIDDLKYSSFLFQINCMLNDRLNFRKSMEYLVEKKLIDLDFINFKILHEICQEWKMLKTSIIKKIVTQNVQLLYIEVSEKLKKIATLEYKLIEQLLK